MKLTRLRVSQVRQFRGTLEVPDFDPGLNLFFGPNETGKSTVVRAIRAAFLERHRSLVIEDLLPRGETASTCSPAIELQFDFGGQPHVLSKSFFHKKRCAYSAGGKQYDGEAAEDAVAAMLGFSFAGKGASKASNWGIPGLLWVQQGDGQNVADPVGHARDHLRTALESTVSTVASTAGDDVLTRLRAERGLLLTPETGKARGQYAETISKLESVNEQIKSLDDQIATYQSNVDRLASLRAAHASDSTKKPWEAFRVQHEAAKAALVAAQQLAQRLKDMKEAERTVATTSEVLSQQLAAFANQRASGLQRELDHQAAKADMDAAQSVATTWERRRGQVVNEVEAAARAVDGAEVENQRATLMQRLADATAQQQRLAGVVDQGAGQAEAVERHKAEVAANEVKEDDLKDLAKHVDELRDLAAMQRAAATMINLALMPDVKVTLDGRQVDGQSEHRVVASTTIEIEDVGTIVAVPGANATNDLAGKIEKAQALRDAVLRRIGVVSVEEAHARADRHSSALAQFTTASQVLKASAPRGLDHLRTELASAQAIADTAAHQLGALPPTPEHAPDAAATVATNTRTIDLVAARQALQGAHAAQQEVNTRHSEAAQALARAQAKEQAAATELARVRVAISEAELSGRQTVIQADLATTTARLQEIRAAIANLESQLQTSQIDALHLEVQRLKASMDSALQSFQQRANQISSIEGALDQAGAQGLEERRAMLLAERDHLLRRHAELQLRAQALQLLVQRMEDKRQALTRRLQAPLQRRLEHYLRLLFPNGRLALQEDLTPGALSRGLGHDDAEFELLSFGAQEQLGLISRLAYADLLQEAGKPTLIILDDALVHSDHERLDRMQRVLFDAAQRHQVLLFTCQPERWTALGARPRELRSFVTSSVVPTTRTTKKVTAEDL